MKRPAVAAGLSFIIPGLGLWYVGLPRFAALNLMLAILIPTLLGVLWPGDYVPYLLLAIAAGSAGCAHAAATRASP